MTSRTPRSHCAPRSCVRTERTRRTTAPTYPEPAYPCKGEYAQEAAAAALRYAEPCSCRLDCSHSDEFKLSEATSSETLPESGAELGARDSEPHYQEAPPGAEAKQRGKAAHPKHYPEPDSFDEPTTHRLGLDRRAPEYGDKRGYVQPASDPHPAVASHKLQRLKELQWRRNLTEKYYSQEINRLIGDQYAAFENRLPGGQTARHPEKVPLSQSYVGDRAQPPSTLSNLEQCGTMVTITRLDCGCVEQTTRPIYTTLSGQTQKRNCVQEQQVQMNMSAPTARIVMPANHQPLREGPQPGAKLRSKSFAAEPARRAANDHEAHPRPGPPQPPPPQRRPSTSSVVSA